MNSYPSPEGDVTMSTGLGTRNCISILILQTLRICPLAQSLAGWGSPPARAGSLIRQARHLRVNGAAAGQNGSCLIRSATLSLAVPVKSGFVPGDDLVAIIPFTPCLTAASGDTGP